MLKTNRLKTNRLQIKKKVRKELLVYLQDAQL